MPAAAAATATATAIARGSLRAGCPAIARGALLADGDSPETASRSYAMSRADWKRSSGLFSRQCETSRSSAGATLRAVSARGGGSSFRIALRTSAEESPRKARRPESIS